MKSNKETKFWPKIARETYANCKHLCCYSKHNVFAVCNFLSSKKSMMQNVTTLIKIILKQIKAYKCKANILKLYFLSGSKSFNEIGNK